MVNITHTLQDFKTLIIINLTQEVEHYLNLTINGKIHLMQNKIASSIHVDCDSDNDNLDFYSFNMATFCMLRLECLHWLSTKLKNYITFVCSKITIQSIINVCQRYSLP